LGAAVSLSAVIYASPVPLELIPIGYIHTPFASRSDAPHQPDADAAIEGVIDLLPGHNFEQALDGIEGMEKIWLLYWFDRNTNWKPKVLVPRGPAVKRGLFSTRSPYRPNPIGLTLVDLIEVNGLRLRVRNVDILDGTPILDIKPYLPAIEAHPGAVAGWIDEVEEQSLSPLFDVEFAEAAKIQLAFLQHNKVELLARIRSVLEYHVDPHPYKRIERDAEGLYLAARAWRIRFTVTGKIVTVTAIRSGYSREQLEDAMLTGGGDLADSELQVAFYREFGSD
jgi:tRNA-Thr(GGU) m(6)t(6)A37 methyltransferase TsaA